MKEDILRNILVFFFFCPYNKKVNGPTFFKIFFHDQYSKVQYKESNMTVNNYGKSLKI